MKLERERERGRELLTIFVPPPLPRPKKIPKKIKKRLSHEVDIFSSTTSSCRDRKLGTFKYNLSSLVVFYYNKHIPH